MTLSQPCLYLLKLRRNIALESDLLLARLELEAFLDVVEDVHNIEDFIRSNRQVAAASTHAFVQPTAYARPQGQQAYTARAPLSALPELIRCVSFVQAIYCVAEATPQTQAFAAEMETALGPVIESHVHDGQLIMHAVPHYALMELSQVVVRRSKNIADTKRNMQAVLDALLGRTDAPDALRLAGEALSAQSTTAHLSHDIHYYKAKFFPRMARAMLNVCARRLEPLPKSLPVHGEGLERTQRPTPLQADTSLGEGAASLTPPLNAMERGPVGEILRVLDNFAGSGTTLLEASLLGMDSVGLDIDPLSVLIARAKVGVLALDSGQVAEQVGLALERLKAASNGQRSLFDYPHPQPLPIAMERGEGEGSATGAIEAGGIVFPGWLLKNRRMTPETAAELSREIVSARAALERCAPEVSDLFRVLLSDAVARRIRMRFLGTGVGRFSLTFSKTPLASLLARSLAEYVRVVAVCEWLRETLRLRVGRARVLEADTRHIPDNAGRFDIALTSPPYLPASSGRESYAKARAPSLIALGLYAHDGVDSLADESIGSMEAEGVYLGALTDEARALVEWLARDDLRAPKAGPAARYFVDMRRAFAEMGRVLSPGGQAVVVSGRQSTFYRFATREALYVARSAQLLADEARLAGLAVEALHDLPLKKANRNARPRSLDDYYETLILLRKAGP